MSGKIKAIILAAGRGTRMGIYGTDKPKGLLEISGKTLIQHQVDALRQAGISNIVIVTGYKQELINISGTKKIHNPDFATTNMIESLMCARSELDGEVIIAYADIVYRVSLIEQIIECKGGDIVVAVDDNWRCYWQARYGSTEKDLESLTVENGQIRELGKSLTSSADVKYRYIGLLKYNDSAWERVFNLYQRKMNGNENWLSSGKPFPLGYMTDLLNELIADGVTVTPCVTSSGWFEFDEEHDYELALRLQSAGQSINSALWPG